MKDTTTPRKATRTGMKRGRPSISSALAGPTLPTSIENSWAADDESVDRTPLSSLIPTLKQVITNDIPTCSSSSIVTTSCSSHSMITRPSKRPTLSPGSPDVKCSTVSTISKKRNKSSTIGGKGSTKKKYGLREYSKLVYQKVQEKTNTTYSEVADDLVKDIQKIAAANAAAGKDNNTLLTILSLENGTVKQAPIQSSSKKRLIKRKKRRANQNIVKRSTGQDDKNIRRRVYDALNVLMALNVISRHEDKSITWNGWQEENLATFSSKGDKDSLTRPASALEEKDRLEKQVQHNKRELQERIRQIVALENLCEKNRSIPLVKETTNESALHTGIKVEDSAESKCSDVCVSCTKNRSSKIHLPFLLVNTNVDAQISMDWQKNGKELTIVNEGAPFVICDDYLVLTQKFGLHRTTREKLMQQFPSNLVEYCEEHGIFRDIVKMSDDDDIGADNIVDATLREDDEMEGIANKYPQHQQGNYHEMLHEYIQNDEQFLIPSYNHRHSLPPQSSEPVGILVGNVDVSPSIADNDDLQPDFSDTTTNFPYPLIEDSFFSTFPEDEVPGATRTDVASIIDDPSTEDTLKTVCI